MPLDRYMLPMALCADAVAKDGALVGDPTEGALVVLAAKGSIDPVLAREKYPRIAEVPFDAVPATVDRVANGLDVTISSDVSQLSPAAVQQIVCTLLGVQPVGTVNLRGGGHSLEFQKCA